MNNINNTNVRKACYQVAYILQLIMTIIEGLALIPLIWCLPMLKATKKAMNEVGQFNEKPHIVLAILSILLTTMFGGAAMLIADLAFNSSNNRVSAY